MQQEFQNLTVNANNQIQNLNSRIQSLTLDNQNLNSQFIRERDRATNLQRSADSALIRNSQTQTNYTNSQTVNQNSNNTTIINQILQFVGMETPHITSNDWAEVANLRSTGTQNAGNDYDFEALVTYRSQQQPATTSAINFTEVDERDGPMYNLLQAILTISGVIIVASIFVPTFDKEKKWTPLIGMLASFSFKIAAICLAASEITVLYVISHGVLSFSIIGVYVACAAIIIASVRDLFSGSNFLTNLAVVASHKANQMQDEINRKAAEMAESAKKAEGEKNSEIEKKS